MFSVSQFVFDPSFPHEYAVIGHDGILRVHLVEIQSNVQAVRIVCWSITVPAHIRLNPTATIEF